MRDVDLEPPPLDLLPTEAAEHLWCYPSKIRSPADVRSTLMSGIALRRRPVIREKADKYTPARVLEGKMPFRMAHGRSVDLPDGYDTQDSTRLEQSFAAPRANAHGCARQAWSLLSMKMSLKRGPVQA
jgi:hypothetical protein